MYNYRLKTLTPIHIGNGKKLSNNFDYLIEGTKINVVSFDRYISNIAESEDEISKLERYIETLKKGNSIFDLIRKPTSEEIKYSVILNTKTPNPEVREIAEYIKTVLNEKGEYGAYIPGSTVKGFIRLAILYKILKENANLVNCDEKMKKTEEKIFSAKLQKQTLEMMTYFKVADSEPISTKNLEVRNIIITNNKIPEFAEVIKKDTEIKIIIEDKEFQEKLGKLDLKYKYLETIKNWKNTCYEFSKSIIEHEKEFFKKKGLVKLKNFYEYLEKENHPEAPLLRIGKYKGKISQTLVLLYKTNKEKYGCLFEDKKGKNNKNINPLPKTRRIIEDDFPLPLGWVKLEKLN
jgi:CRISPR type III-A-associated RAMP protein Csm5